MLSGVKVPQRDPEGERPWRVPHHARGQQGGSGTTASREFISGTDSGFNRIDGIYRTRILKKRSH